MPDRINVMPQSLANLIAAGEVVERPASAVKELVENSIDAKAKNVFVQIIGGGLKSIVVKDDGTGMDRHDAKLSILRHASSKIKTSYDLVDIKTMGFRGEALPSIVSVSEFTMDTSDGLEGTHLEASGENAPSFSDAALRKGTTITVKNLFYNTPARLKYMKSEQYERSRCIDVLERIALGFPNVAVELRGDDNKPIFSTTGRNDVIEVIQRIWGNDIAKRITHIKTDNQVSFSIDFYLANPEINYANKYQIMTFLNNRYIYSYKLNKAVEEAYRDYLSPLRYPFVVLKVEIDPELVDVNVHPSKKEVRISCEDELANSIKVEILKFLKSTKPIYTERQSQELLHRETIKEVETPKENPLNKVFDSSKSLGGNQFSPKPTYDNLILKETPNVSFQGNNPQELEKTIEEVATLNHLSGTTQVKKEDNTVETKPNPYSDLMPIGQIAKTYIICDSPFGLSIVDQHAAAERINFEKYEKLFKKQIVLVNPIEPLVVELPPSIILSFNEEKKDLLKKMGLDVEIFGNNALKLMGVPEFLTDKDYEGVLRDIIIGVSEGRKEDPSVLMRKAISTIACKASVRAGQLLSPFEQVALIKQLGQCENPANCPHGRPTVVKISIHELEKMFKRTGF